MDIFRKRLLPIVILTTLAITCTVITYFYLSLPSVKLFKECFTTSMHQVAFCPTSKSYVKYNSLPKHLVQALVISEDGTFFTHKGFDFDEMQKSFEENLKTRSRKRGGSTISQQLVKNAFLYKEKSYFRKFKEALLTLQLERNYTKQQILEFYFNVVEFAPKVYGIRSAARHYFQKSVSELTPVESSFLVQLLPNPKSYSRGFFQPIVNERIFKRTKLKFLNLYYYKRINEEQYQAGLQELSQPPWSQQVITMDEAKSELEDVEYLNQEEELQEENSPQEEQSPEEPTTLDPSIEEDVSNTP